MYTTNIFNLLNRYDCDADSNPVADLVLNHGCALLIDKTAALELELLIDVLTSNKIKLHKDSNNTLHMYFPGQTIEITSHKTLTLNGQAMPCICEECKGLVSFISSGEVVTIIPIKLLED